MGHILPFPIQIIETHTHKVLLPEIDSNVLLSDLHLWSLDCADSEIQEEAAHHFIASYVNKNTSGMSRSSFESFPALCFVCVEVTEFIAKQTSLFWEQDIKDTSKPAARRKTAIRSLLWV